MSEVFYRKYRPKSFAEVKGQEHIVSILTQALKSNNLSHAYLFTGPRGTGKTTIARLLAKAVNCLGFEDTSDVCNTCVNCNQINAGSSVDIIEMDAASNRGIEEIRSLKDGINFVPSNLKKKVYIIDEAHMLTKEAFNALLKTLEEPPSHVIFILATTEAHKLPITILSRVQRYDFRLATFDELLSKLDFIVQQEGVTADRQTLELLFTQSGGSYRDAESLLSKVLTTINGKELSKDTVVNALGLIDEQIIDQFISLILEKKDIRHCIDHIRDLKVKGLDIDNFLDKLIVKLKELLILSFEANTYSRSELLNVLNGFLEAKKDLRYFADKILPIEITLAKILGGSLSAPSSNSVPTVNKPEPPISAKVSEKKEAVLTMPKEDTTTPMTPNSSSSTKEINITNILEKLEGQSSGNHTRLKSILKTSDIIVVGSVVVIKNRYKFNIDYILKPEIRNILLTIVKSLDSGIESIDANKLEGEAKETKIQNSEVKTVSSAVSVSEAPKQQYQTNQEVTKETNFDNSEMVEAIL